MTKLFITTISLASILALPGLSFAKDTASISANSIKQAATSIIGYWNDTLYQLPKGYQKSTPQLQKALNHITQQEKSASSMNEGSLNFLSLSAWPGNTSHATVLLPPDAEHATKKQEIIRLFCHDASNSNARDAKICKANVHQLPNNGVNNDALLYLLSKTPTSSTIVPLLSGGSTYPDHLPSMGGNTTTRLATITPNNKITDFNQLFNHPIYNLVNANFFSQYLSGAYLLNTALNPCFGMQGQISAITGDAQSNTKASSGASQTQKTKTDPCANGISLVNELTKLIAQDAAEAHANKCVDDTADQCAIAILIQSPAYHAFQIAMRATVAKNSLILSNLYFLFGERLKKPTGLTDKNINTILTHDLPPCAKNKDKKTKVTNCSALELQRFIANHRLDSDSPWYKRLKTAAPSLVQREQTLILAESLQLQQRQYELLERILASTTLIDADGNYMLASSLNDDIKALDQKMKSLEK